MKVKMLVDVAPESKYGLKKGEVYEVIGNALGSYPGYYVQGDKGAVRVEFKECEVVDENVENDDKSIE